MAQQISYFDFTIFYDINYFPVDTFINGRIYNISYDNELYGTDDNPIVKSKLVREGTNYYLRCYSESNETLFTFGGYIPNGTYGDPFRVQGIIGVEENSELYNILIGYFDYVDYKTVQPKKYAIPSTEKSFMSYTFDNSLLGRERKISCLMNFKIGNTEYVGFEFTFTSTSDTPEFITFYQSNGDSNTYSPYLLSSTLGNQVFEILNTTEIAEPIYNWLTSYLEEYVEPYDPNMTLNCYKYNSQFNRVDKTDYLTKVIDIVGVPRDEFVLTHPSFTIELDTPPNFNYVYIEKLNRYFFVEDIIYLRYNLYEIRLKVDVLMTYKDGLLQLDAFIDRNEFRYNDNIIDKRRVFEQGVDVDSAEIYNNVEWIYGDGTTIYETTKYFILNGYKLKAGGTS